MSKSFDIGHTTFDAGYHVCWFAHVTHGMFLKTSLGLGAIALAFLMGIWAGAKGLFPTDSLGRLSTAAERWFDSDKIYVGRAHELSRYEEGLNSQAMAVFVGDSLIQRGHWAEIFGNACIHERGIGGDTVSGVLSRLDQVIAKRPESVFIMIGINDIAAGNEVEDILRVYRQMLAKLTGHTKTYVHSVLPCDTSVCSDSDRRKIALLNQGIAELASNIDSVSYIDLTRILAADGSIDNRYTIDGIHLTTQGYMVWRDEIAPLILPRLGSAAQNAKSLPQHSVGQNQC